MEKIQCEICGDYWQEFAEDNLVENFENIQKTGRCLDCSEEWGDNWPDRV